MLDGQGADEAFAGYPVFSRHGLVERLLHADVNGSLAHLRGVKTYTGAGIARQLTAAAACLAPNWIRRATSPFMSSSRLMESLFDAQSLGGLGTDPFARLGRCATVRACSLQQIQAASLPMLLHWEDRNSMSSSIEARVPFLSPVLVETALGLPYWAKVNGGVTKSILREAMRGTVPDEILDRRDKVGFEAPERTWLTGSGTSATMNTMVDRALEHVDHVLTPSGRARITEIRAGNRTYDRVLWRLICMGVWIERFAVRW
jgi:asparagine synthase (glutamine-hydrolysing)